MSDMPKGLRYTSKVRWGLFAAAALLTVTTGFLLWIELTDGASPSARAFVWNTALTMWLAGTLVSCTLLGVRLIKKYVDCWGKKILQAIATERASDLYDLLEKNNVTPMYGRK